MTEENLQKEIIAFLAAPATHGGVPVRQFQTHISYVFLAAGLAYKIKRAVKFPYLDFSSLQKRLAACLAELEVNRRFSPRLYHRVVPITRETDGSLAIVGSGAVVEWVVEMQRFDELATLDHLAIAGKIDNALADQLGRLIAKAHFASRVAGAAAWIAELQTYIERNQKVFAENPELFVPENAAALCRLSQAALKRLMPLLEKRGELDFIRQGHGDLHLGNIALIANQPVLFDAIEFDPLVASGDVLYDLAFLLMDLIARGLQPAADIVLNRYLSEAGRDENLEGLAALSFFLSLRAAIRANVISAKLAMVPEVERPAIARSAGQYFDFACALILPATPRLIAIGGLSGTGKSALASILAPAIPPAPGAILLRSDSERKCQFGVTETRKLAPEAYRDEVTASVYAALAAKARTILAAGHSVIVDAMFACPHERCLIEDAAQDFIFHGIFLQADLATRLRRVGLRVNDASDAGQEVVIRQESYDLGRLDWYICDASGAPVDVAATARRALSL